MASSCLLAGAPQGEIVGRVDYDEVIESIGGKIASLSTRERWEALQRWREVYAANLHATTGSWKRGDYEWHVFSFEFAEALNGHRAVEEYLAQQPHEFLVVPEDESCEAIQIAGGKLPDLRRVRDDIYVWPTDLEWTMAFTHEESIGLGPYFSRRKWLGELLAPKRRPRRS